jgi:toxin ParE1/3/4
MRVRFTPSAREEFLEALAYIHQDNPSAARRFRGRVEHVLRRLERFPDSGRRLPELPELPHREVVVAPYRFFYRIRGRTVWIVAVWHGARQVQEPSE